MKMILLLGMTTLLNATNEQGLLDENLTNILEKDLNKKVALTDYKIINGQYYDAYINGSFSASNAFDTKNPNTTREENSYDAHIDSNFKNIYNSANYSWTIAGTVNANWTKSSEKNSKTNNAYDTLGYTIFDKYFSPEEKLFYFGSGIVAYKKIVGTSKSLDPFLKIGTGLGYGRVYDATALAKALRIIEDLVEYKLIKPNISKEAQFALANILDQEDVFESKYGGLEYKKYWYQSIEKVLKEYDVLTNNELGAFGIVRISEILDIEKVSKRLHGWKLRAGLGKVLSSQVDDSQNETFDTSFEYGFPIGLKSQFYTNAILTKVLNQNYDLKLNFVNIANYTYEVNNLLDWENAYTFNYSTFDIADNFASHTFSSGFRYYLASQLQFTTSLSAVKTDVFDDWDMQLFSGFTYRLK